MEITIELVQAGVILVLLVGLIMAVREKRQHAARSECWEDHAESLQDRVKSLSQIGVELREENTMLTTANDDMRNTIAHQAAKILLLQQELEELGTQQQAPPVIRDPVPVWTDPLPTPTAPPVADDHAIDLDKFEDRTEELLGHVPIAKED